MSNLTKRFIMGRDRDRERLTNFQRRIGGRETRLREQMARECQSKLSAQDFSIPRERGFSVTPPGVWEQVEPMEKYALETVEKTPPDALEGKKKSQLRTGFIKPESLDLDSPHLQFALRPDILEAVSAYMGIVPILFDVDVWYSQHHGGDLQNSQLYHCDWDDVTQVKIFSYAREVKLSAGPLVLIDAKNSQHLRNARDYVFDFQHNRLTDDEAHEIVDASEETAIIGPPGTTAFVDTSRCFHYGSRSQEPRILTFFQYLTPSAFKLPKNYRDTLPFKHLEKSENLTPLQRLVLGGEA